MSNWGSNSSLNKLLNNTQKDRRLEWSPTFADMEQHTSQVWEPYQPTTIVQVNSRGIVEIIVEGRGKDLSNWKTIHQSILNNEPKRIETAGYTELRIKARVRYWRYDGNIRVSEKISVNVWEVA
jgi:hypothetical protein